MGSSFNYSCSNCGYSFEFMLGIGFLYNPVSFYLFDWDEKENMWIYNEDNMFLSVIKSKKMLQEIKDIIMNKKGYMNDKYGHELYYSKTCKKIYSRFYFKLSYFDDGKKKVYVPKYYDEYKKKLVRVKENDVYTLNIECPKCKGTEFDRLIGPCWD